MTRLSLLAGILLCAVSAVSAAELTDINKTPINQAGVPMPYGPAPVAPPGVTIANYTTDETVTFETQAKPAMDARIAALNAAGITTLGGRVVPLGNNYSYVIDYLPTVKNGTALPPAVLAATYNNGAAYWLANDATAAMNSCASSFRSARLPVLGSYLYPVGNGNAFAVDYLAKNELRPTAEYDVKFMYYTGGKFTFESDAVKNIPAYLAQFKAAGVPAIRGKAVGRPDNNYAVQVEYVIKTNKFGDRPQYSVSRYDSRETFPFEKDALAASKTRLQSFTAAGVPPVSSVSRPEGTNYSYSVDFLVENIYQQGGVIPSAAIETYQAQETFTFDTEAKKALADKVTAFNAAGMGVVGSAVTGALGSFSYVIDYVAKAGQPGPGPQPR